MIHENKKSPQFKIIWNLPTIILISFFDYIPNNLRQYKLYFSYNIIIYYT